MREYREAGYAIVDIARYFRVTVKIVSRVVNYRTHVNVKPEAHHLAPLLTPEERAARQARTRRAIRGRAIAGHPLIDPTATPALP